MLGVILGVTAAGDVATIGESTGGDGDVIESAGEETIGLFMELAAVVTIKAHVRVSKMSLVVRR